MFIINEVFRKCLFILKNMEFLKGKFFNFIEGLVNVNILLYLFVIFRMKFLRSFLVSI